MNNLAEIKNKLPLVYTGTVTVKVQDSTGKIVSKNIYHNAGTKYLSQFLCFCLGGNYKQADKYRPFSIGLFYNKKSKPTDQVDELIPQVPIYISINKVATTSAELEGNKVINYKTVLHFLIPYSYFTGTERQIRQVCLYSKDTVFSTSAAKNYKDYSATFLLTKDNGTAWDPISLASANTSYNLIIDWEMSFNVEEETE